MEWYLAMTLLLGTVCVGMFLGLPVAFAFFAANVLGTALFINGDIGLVMMPIEFHNAIKFTLAAIPLFLRVIEQAHINDLDVERMLTLVRRGLLEAAVRVGAGTPAGAEAALLLTGEPGDGGSPRR